MPVLFFFFQPPRDQRFLSYPPLKSIFYRGWKHSFFFVHMRPSIGQGELIAECRLIHFLPTMQDSHVERKDETPPNNLSYQQLQNVKTRTIFLSWHASIVNSQELKILNSTTKSHITLGRY